MALDSLLPFGLLLSSVACVVLAHVDVFASSLDGLTLRVSFESNQSALRSVTFCSCLLFLGFYQARVWPAIGRSRPVWLACFCINLMLYMALIVARGHLYPGMVNSDPVNFIYGGGAILLMTLVLVEAMSGRSDKNNNAALRAFEALTAHYLWALFTVAYSVLAWQDHQETGQFDARRVTGAALCYASFLLWLLSPRAKSAGHHKHGHGHGHGAEKKEKEQ